jgi:AraC family transcriptional regulator of adaptative response / DNA-3-methyladenine glycosylase II
MVLDADGCYRALRSHDARFDGVFYVAIRTTGIYCRPVCPARPARRESCVFYDTAAAAEQNGYRPCLRCRPELAPGNARIDASARLASAALARIESGALNDAGVDELAAEFGVTSRHLRRAVEGEFGVSPVEIAQTQRLLLAKQLLTETGLSVTNIAFASGFGSLRRFNALFQARYRLAPRRLRGRHVIATPADCIACDVGYRPPFDWSGILGFLRARAIAGIETIDENRYARVVKIGEHRGRVSVSPVKGKNALRVELSTSLTPVLPAVLARVKRLFDLGAHPQLIEDRLGEDPLLRPMVRANPGLRVPGAFDGFEMALRAVLGQQISVRGATTIAGRFVAAFDGLDAGRIADAGNPAIRALGLTNARAECVLGLARAAADGRVRLEPCADVASAMAALKELPGIGEWTAQYIAMRALGWPDAFPHTDLGVIKALGVKAERRILEMSAAWSPWRAYATMHLWKSLAGKAQ